MNPIANVLDLELNDKFIIEIGITMVDLDNLKILKTISMPIWPQPKPLNQEIVELTHWTDRKLEKQGVTLATACKRIREKYGPNRMLIIDQEDELYPFEYMAQCVESQITWEEGDPVADWPRSVPFSGQTLNISDIYRIATKTIDYDVSLEKMLRKFNMEFEGTQHRGGDDSKNIARLFIKLMMILREGSNGIRRD